MTDTAQPVTAADPEVVPADPIAAGAEAFKIALGQSPPPERARDGRGRFASPAAESGPEGEDEIDAAAEGEPKADAENQGDDDDEQQAADEAQPEAVDLPSSWPAEHEETWKSLPPETQAFIVEREGQRDTAVNTKFQEAANVRKAAEAAFTEAQATRQKHAEGLDQVLSLIQPRWPSPTMLDFNSNDYDPDNYHLQRAQCEEQQALVDQLSRQRQSIAAQAQDEAARATVARFQEINAATRDAFIKDVPDVADQAKAPAIFTGLMEYAIAQGAPADTFETPTTALEWRMIWKAKEYDRLQAAKAKVGSDPKPEPRRAQPAVRPGVTTSRSAIDAAKRSKDFQRLDREGSVEAGAAVWKNFLKGT